MGPADLPRQEGGGLDVVVLSILQHLVLLTGGQLGQRRVRLSPFGPGGQQKMETVDQRVATAARAKSEVGWLARLVPAWRREGDGRMDSLFSVEDDEVPLDVLQALLQLPILQQEQPQQPGQKRAHLHSQRHHLASVKTSTLLPSYRALL